MDGFLRKIICKMDMLDKGKGVLCALTILFASCKFQEVHPENYYKRVSENIVGIREYNRIFKLASDSLQIWIQNKLGYYRFCGEYKYCYLDSLICFNKNGTRFRGVLLSQQFLENSMSDDIDYFYGEKIKDQWYFFKNENLMVPRSMIKGHDPKQFLSYAQLHQVALEEVFRGYITMQGEINDDWVNANFEDAGWGKFEDQAAMDWVLHGKRFKTRKEFFENAHLNKVRNNWGEYQEKKDSIIKPQLK